MSQCPFIAAGRIEKPESFIGRKDELNSIKTKMANVQPTSINVHGEKRIGKSSLLYHFFLTWEQRISPEDRKKFVVVYVSLESAECQQESGFYQRVATALCAQSTIKNNPILQQAWAVSAWTRTAFNQAVTICKTEQVLPVLLLDNIETALQHNQQFDDGFYSNFRSLMDDSSLMLVIASFESLKSPVYKSKYGLPPSFFFNLGQTIELKEFDNAEVTELLKLAEKAGMTAERQKLIHQWGNHHPYRLQLAGEWLYEAWQANKPISWAKQRFDQQINRPRQPTESSLKSIGNKLLLPFYGLGHVVKWIGHIYHEFHIFIFGLFLSLGIVALLLGKDSIVHFLLEPLIHLWHLLTELLENLWK